MKAALFPQLKSPKMNKKITLPWSVLVLFLISAFLIGSIWQKLNFELQPQSKRIEKEIKTVRFQPEKNDQPKIEIFMQTMKEEDKLIQARLANIASFFGENVSWQPYYLFTSTIQPLNNQNCMETAGDTFYCSPLGKPQINQQIRELCAWELTNDIQRWWGFVSRVSQNCQLDNIDQCWQVEAKITNLPEEQIQDCFSRQATPIIENQIQAFEDKKISQTPSLIINNRQLPLNPKDSQEEVVVRIENQYFQPNQLNTPEYFIAAICSSLNKPLDICD